MKILYSILFTLFAFTASAQDWRDVPDKVIRQAAKIKHVKYIGVTAEANSSFIYTFQKDLNPVISFKRKFGTQYFRHYKMFFDIETHSLLRIKRERNSLIPPCYSIRTVVK